MKLTLEEIRKLKDSGELKPMCQDAKPYDLPNEFWNSAKLVAKEALK